MPPTKVAAEDEADEGEEEEVNLKSELGGWRQALEAPFDQIEKYNRYVRGGCHFISTLHGHLRFFPPRAPNPDFELVNFIVLAGLVPAIHAHPSGKVLVERRGYAGQARA